VILCKLTIMAICTDIELLEAPLLRAVTKISLVFGSDVRRGKSGTFETEASRSVTGHPHIAKKYRAAKTPALDEVPGRHLLGSAVVRFCPSTYPSLWRGAFEVNGRSAILF